MDLRRLFHVLVVGGSVAAGCERSRTSGLSVADAAAVKDVGMAESAPESPVAMEDAAAEADVVAMDSATADATAALDTSAAEVAAMDGAAADAAAANDGPMGSPCFCSPTRCCDLHEGAPATVQPGVFCCWGTSC